VEEFLILPPGSTAADISASMGGLFAVHPHGSFTRKLVFYDTPSWSLWLDGLAMVSDGSSLELYGLRRGWVGEVIYSLSPCIAVPRFWRDLAPGPLRDALKPVVGDRCLLPIAEFESATQRFDLLNESGKTVCRVYLDALHHSGGGTGVTGLCRVQSLRGYGAETMEVTHRLLAAGLYPLEYGPLGAAVRESVHSPEAFGVRLEVDFPGGTGAREAVRSILSGMLAKARRHESGVIGDLDSEFLHDYRVCLRKVRSVLSLLKGVYPEDLRIGWSARLGALARRTNHLRDLDVYLGAREEFEKLLPPSLHGGLGALFGRLASERHGAWEEVARYFGSPEYAAEIDDLGRAFGPGTDYPESPRGGVAIAPLAARGFARRYRKVSVFADGMTPDAPSSAIHTIRIQCKKLRYLLEFFGRFFPQDSRDPLASELGRLQNRLGDFNDLAVQQRYLLDLVPDAGGDGASMTRAIGGLVAVLHAEHEDLRSEVLESLAAFCSQKNAARVRQIVKEVKRSTRAGSPAIDPP